MEFVFTMGLVTIAYLITVNRKQARQIKNINKRIDKLFLIYGKEEEKESEGRGG